MSGRKQVQGITIDDVSTRDIDDAIRVEKSDAGWTVFVSIADVAHAVLPGTPEDQRAHEMVATKYFAQGNSPMLPPRLSEDELSLWPHRPRRTITVEIRVPQDSASPRAPYTARGSSAAPSSPTGRSWTSSIHAEPSEAPPRRTKRSSGSLRPLRPASGATTPRRRDGALRPQQRLDHDRGRVAPSTRRPSRRHGADPGPGDDDPRQHLRGAMGDRERSAGPVPQPHSPPRGSRARRADETARRRHADARRRPRHPAAARAHAARQGRLRRHGQRALRPEPRRVRALHIAHPPLRRPRRAQADPREAQGRAAAVHARARRPGLPPHQRDGARGDRGAGATCQGQGHRARQARHERAQLAGMYAKDFERACKTWARSAEETPEELVEAFQMRIGDGTVPPICLAVAFAEAPDLPAWRRIRELLLQHLASKPQDAVSLLATALQLGHWSTPVVAVDQSGPPHAPVFRAAASWAVAEGASIDIAHQGASKKRVEQEVAVLLIAKRFSMEAPPFATDPAPRQRRLRSEEDLRVRRYQGPISLLMEYCQAHRVEPPKFAFEQHGPPHCPSSPAPPAARATSPARAPRPSKKPSAPPSSLSSPTSGPAPPTRRNPDGRPQGLDRWTGHRRRARRAPHPVAARPVLPGHRPHLAPANWSEVPLSQNLRVQQGLCVRYVKGGDLLRDHESWVGRVAQDSQSVESRPAGGARNDRGDDTMRLMRCPVQVVLGVRRLRQLPALAHLPPAAHRLHEVQLRRVRVSAVDNVASFDGPPAAVFLDSVGGVVGYASDGASAACTKSARRSAGSSAGTTRRCRSRGQKPSGSQSWSRPASSRRAGRTSTRSPTIDPASSRRWAGGGGRRPSEKPRT